MESKPPIRRALRLAVLTCLAALPSFLATAPAHAGVLPEIRTSGGNGVPACVTPDRLMTFLRSRNRGLDPRFKDIAQHYKTFGEAWRVRWDYAFYQMAIETNFLTYRQPNGRMGDVDPAQNNFAGIGTTGGGVPGDSFPDVKTGVHAQIQHLVVYSGERLAAPIAPRTKLKQDDILKASLALERPVRFNDLARRWAVDKNYDKSIEWVAGQYRSRFCRGGDKTEASVTSPPRKTRMIEAGAGSTPAMKTSVSDAPAPAPATTTAKSPSAGATGHPAVRTIWVRSAPGGLPPAGASPAPAPAAERGGPSSNDRSASGGPAAKDTGEPSRTAMLPAAASLDETAANVAALEPTQGADRGETSLVEAAAPGAGTEKRKFDSIKSPPQGLGAEATKSCSIASASYGGSKSVLIKTRDGESVRYTVLSVLDGFEKSMTESFLKARTSGGSAIGEFASRDAAFEMARTLCPSERS